MLKGSHPDDFREPQNLVKAPGVFVARPMAGCPQPSAVASSPRLRANRLRPLSASFEEISMEK